jgi:hypothetical protein
LALFFACEERCMSERGDAREHEKQREEECMLACV